MRQRLQQLLTLLQSPLVLGLVLTLAFVYLAFTFYILRGKAQAEDNWLIKQFNTIDEKSIDLRLQARGPRQGSPQVALLTVDEKSVRTVGRWPWPRETLGKAVENATKYGAKVLAFDIVFGEPSHNAAHILYDRLKQRGPVPPVLDQRIQSELKNFDSDKIMSDTLGRVSDHVVMGTFYEHANDEFRYRGAALSCLNLIFESTPSFQIWNKEQVLLGVIDSAEKTLPEVLSKAYSTHLQAIKEEFVKSQPFPRNSSEADDLRLRTIDLQLEACRHFLDPEKDDLYSTLQENWQALQGADEDLKSYPTFEAWVQNFKDSTLGNHIVLAENWVMNTPLLSANVKHTGFFNAQQDEDGTIRRSRLVVRTGTHYMPSIALKSFLVANNYNANIELEPDPKAQYRVKKIKRLAITNNDTGDEVFEIPVDFEGNLLINYAGPQNMFEYVSLGDLLNDDPNLSVTQRMRDKETKRWLTKEKTYTKTAFFKDKQFIVGATAIGIYDLRVTPFDENFPGAETHVNVLDNLIRQDFLRTNFKEEQYMLIGLLILGVLLSLALTHLGALSGLLVTLITLICIVILDHMFLFGKGWVVSIAFPFLLTATIYVGLTFYKYFTEERNKRELKSTFQKYVSPAIVNEILKHPDNIELGGRKEKITVFFSDLRGFTTISEKLDPRALSDLLNSYLTPMTEIVFKNRGTLDKYMGDAIMAFFGAPISYNDHAKFACRCALGQLAMLRVLQEEYRKKGLPEIDMGIGLNTGEASVGNMGSETVRNYTVMGDTVNLGSRLEGINKEYGTRIVISESTHSEVKDHFVCRKLDLVKVKGKNLPVQIFELVSEGKPAQNILDAVNYFEQGFDYYLQKKWEEALKSFHSALGQNPADEPSKLYIERCMEFQKDPPPEAWDGVFVMKTK